MPKGTQNKQGAGKQTQDSMPFCSDSPGAKEAGCPPLEFGGPVLFRSRWGEKAATGVERPRVLGSHPASTTAAPSPRLSPPWLGLPSLGRQLCSHCPSSPHLLWASAGRVRDCGVRKRWLMRPLARHLVQQPPVPQLPRGNATTLPPGTVTDLVREPRTVCQVDQSLSGHLGFFWGCGKPASQDS